MVFGLTLGRRSTGTVAPAFIRPALPAPNDVERVFDATQPLFVDGSSATTLSKAESASPYSVATPAGLPASMKTTSPEVWYSTVTDEFGLRYGEQVVILENLWGASQKPAAEYAQQASDWGGEATQLGGKPAWVVPASQGAYPDINMVHVSIGRVDVTIYAKTSLSDAESIAASMETAPGQVASGPGA